MDEGFLGGIFVELLNLFFIFIFLYFGATLYLSFPKIANLLLCVDEG